MTHAGHDALIQRLVKVLVNPNRRESMDPKPLADEFGATSSQRPERRSRLSRRAG